MFDRRRTILNNYIVLFYNAVATCDMIPASRVAAIDVRYPFVGNDVDTIISLEGSYYFYYIFLIIILVAHERWRTKDVGAQMFDWQDALLLHL